MSELEYRSGTAKLLYKEKWVPDVVGQKIIDFIKLSVDFDYQWCEHIEEEDYWDIGWFDNKTKREVVRVNDGEWYLVKYVDYDDGYIHMAHRTVTNDIVFAFCYYNGGTWFGSELEEAIKKLDKVQ